MSLPVFTIDDTMHVNDMVAGPPLSETALASAWVVFTSNVDPDVLIAFEGDLHRPIVKVTADIGDDGTIRKNSQPVELLANDDRLSVSGIQWTAQVFVPAEGGGFTQEMDKLTFNAPESGGMVNLKSAVNAEAFDPMPQFIADNITDATTIGKQILTAVDADAVVDLLGITGGGGGLSAVVDDTTPKLGGDLDADGHKITNLAAPTMPTDAISYAAAVQLLNAIIGDYQLSSPNLTAISAADASEHNLLIGNGTTYEATTLAAFAALLSFLTKLQDDTTPKLGGDLNLNAHNVGDATPADLTALHAQTFAALILSGNMSAGGQRITTLSDPTSDSDAATRGWTNTQIAAATAALLDSAPGTLDTLNELAAALGDDPNFATTVTTALGGKQAITAATTALAALTPAANKLPYFSTSSAAALATLTAFGISLLGAADAAAAKTLLTLTQADVGLGNVDNTADASKYVSYAATAGSASTAGSTTGNAATATKLANARNIAGQAFDGTADITAAAIKTALALAKADVGLSNVDNTSDLVKARAVTNNQTATYTLVLTDASKTVELNNASPITLTVPPNSSVAFTTGDLIELWAQGAGQVTVTAGAGVTIRSAGAKTKLTGQYSSASLRYRGSDEWVLVGDLA